MATVTPAAASTMPPFVQLRARTLCLPQANIDTDQIIPARFLTTTQRSGLGRYAFNDWRYREDGSEDPASVFNQRAAPAAGILVAGRNFGCGSSREHAPWALLDLGLRAVISSEIADIFRGNALKNGLLPIVLDADVVDALLAQPGLELVVDVAERTVTLPDGSRHAFPLDGFARACLLEGVDQLGYLLLQLPAIERFEASRAAARRAATNPAEAKRAESAHVPSGLAGIGAVEAAGAEMRSVEVPHAR